MSYIDVTGKTEEEAISKALAQLGMDRDDVSVEILERAKSGFLGMGAKPARVRVTYGPDDAPMEEVAVPSSLLWKRSRRRKSRSPGPRSPSSPSLSSPVPPSPAVRKSLPRPLRKPLPLPLWSCRSATMTMPSVSPCS